ncbi:MAG: methylated-DNA--[protein]-cysteine S-methyltransferase, partial [Azoarcus sp.]|nr:methylated-DNA--[protein]-cysteine S-methyltransferase [Azoarcus sp.]
MPCIKSTWQTPLGKVIGAAENNAIIGLWFDGQRYFPDEANRWENRPDDPTLKKLGIWLEAYFSGQNPDIDFPLAPCGTPFRQTIWSRLLEIPYGQTASYRALAQRAATSPRAVGGAVGHNPISILIPCHRVIAENGNLTGYAGGLERKTA